MDQSLDKKIEIKEKVLNFLKKNKFKLFILFSILIIFLTSFFWIKYLNKKEEFINYINFVDTLKIDRYDIVFVDGRARKFCALKALDYIDKKSKVIIHDWERPIYKEVLDSYDIIDEIHRVGILRKKWKKQ